VSLADAGVPLVEVTRGERVESVHLGAIAVVDVYGTLCWSAGDASITTFPRSSLKPLQLLALVEGGGVERFGFEPEDLAVMAGSHGGEPIHTQRVLSILERIQAPPEALACGAHPPLNEEAANALERANQAPGALHNNCSGKHAGMLLATQAMDLPSARYIDAGHPLQDAMRSTLADFAGIDADEIPIAIDGCGVPPFFLWLYRAAFAYARLIASSEGAGAPGAVDRYATSAANIVEAMTTFPQYVGGNWTMTTPLM